MTQAEYDEYRERVAAYLAGIDAVSTGPLSGCAECGDDTGEPWFSKRSCEICGDRFDGDREAWHGIIDGAIVHGSCCEDCVYYINYGRLDDKTMAEIERK